MMRTIVILGLYWGSLFWGITICLVRAQPTLVVSWEHKESLLQLLLSLVITVTGQGPYLSHTLAHSTILIVLKLVL